MGSVDLERDGTYRDGESTAINLLTECNAIVQEKFIDVGNYQVVDKNIPP